MMLQESSEKSLIHEEIEKLNLNKNQWKALVHQIIEKVQDGKIPTVNDLKEMVEGWRIKTTSRNSNVATASESVSTKNTSLSEKESEESTLNNRTGKKKKREFQFERCRQRHVAFQIQYDGGRYHGFASQESTETVENCFFDVLLKLKLIEDPKNCQYSRCGRTDKGVSAMGQVVALKLRSAISSELPDHLVPLHPGDISYYQADQKPSSSQPQPLKALQEMDYCTMINALLPEDIRIIGWSPVTENFSSRFSASYRTYRYFFHQQRLNILAMEKACEYLIGSHDFRNFCKLDIANVTNFIREIYSAEIVLYEKHCANQALSVYMLEIKGIAFLWHMIRCIMAILFLIGEEKEDPSIILHLFDVEKNSGKPSYAMADDAPLVLQECGFENLHIYHTPKTLWNLTNHYEVLRNRYLLAATRAQNSLDFILEQSTVRTRDLKVYFEYLCHQRDEEKNRKDLTKTPDENSGDLIHRKRKFEGPSEDQKVEEQSMNEDLFPSSTTIVWKDALDIIYQQTRFMPSQKSGKYIPLLQRKKEESYEERLQKLAGQKKERFERHTDLSVTAKDSTPQFFDNMRKEGTIKFHQSFS